MSKAFVFKELTNKLDAFCIYYILCIHLCAVIQYTKIIMRRNKGYHKVTQKQLSCASFNEQTGKILVIPFPVFSSPKAESIQVWGLLATIHPFLSPIII